MAIKLDRSPKKTESNNRFMAFYYKNMIIKQNPVRKNADMKIPTSNTSKKSNVVTRSEELELTGEVGAEPGGGVRGKSGDWE